MNLKKKLKAFFSFKRRSDSGFTLVELIVVIAILAILAGVGSVGYSGYIKNANKNADKALVGDVIRAMETGHNSYAFQMNEVLQVAADQGLQVPIGFVVLSDKGCTTIQSGNSESTSLKGEACDIITVTVYVDPQRTERTQGEGCDAKTESGYILVGGEEKTFCKTHSLFAYKRDYYFTYPDAGAADENYLERTRDYFYSVTSWDSLIIDHTQGDILADMPVYGSNDAVYDDANSSITKSITAAFGENYAEDMVLKYDGWNMSNFSSFFANATETWGKIKNKAKDATNLSYLEGLGFSLQQKNDEGSAYTDSADLMNDYARTMAQRFTSKEEFAAMWNEILFHDNELPASPTFGKGAEASVGTVAGEDAFYFSGRYMWNQSLAAFIKTNSPCQSRTNHANKVEQYGINLILSQVPKACTYQAFTERIRTYDVGGIATYLEPINCETCQEVAKHYVTSGVATSDAYALYDTFVSLSTVADNGVIYGDEFGDIDLFTFVEAYMKEFDSLYSAVSSVDGESKIAITFFYQDNKLTYEVSNLDADPRNK